MSLFKTKERESLTMLDKVEGKLEKILEQKKEANVRVRETMKKLGEKKSGLNAKLDELDGRIQKMTSEYTEALDGFKAEQAASLTEANVTEEDLRAGRVNVNEFFAVGKRKADIEKESRLGAEAKMEKVGIVIRSLRKERQELVMKLRETEEKMSREYSLLAANFYFSLDAMKKDLEDAGLQRSGVSTAHYLKQEATNDWVMATKGAILHHGKQWKVKTIEEAELIALDPVLQEKHFEDFRKFLDSIRGLDFWEMNINYNPSDSAGRAAGEFWMDYRHKVSER